MLKKQRLTLHVLGGGERADFKLVFNIILAVIQSPLWEQQCRQQCSLARLGEHYRTLFCMFRVIITVNTNRRTRNGVGLGMRLACVHVCTWVGEGIHNE